MTVPDEDWTLKILIDEDERIWELNEDDNIYEKEFQSSESFDVGIIAGVIIGVVAIISAIVILRGRGSDELSKAEKSMPKIEENSNNTKPQNVIKTTDIASKPKRGPPPKKPVQEPQTIKPDITDAMAKLSLDTLPGNNHTQKVPSYESLPAGGDYEYSTEGTFYAGDGIGRWKLEDDGSFTKVG